MKTIALFYGGKSVEHDISVITALQTMSSFPKRYDLIPIYIKPNGEFVSAQNLQNPENYLNFAKNAKKITKIVLNLGKNEIFLIKNNKIKKVIKIDCAVICNHGHGGEDGSLQGLLDLCDIPYSTCSTAVSAITIDKVFTKILLTNAHIDTPKYESFSLAQFSNDKEKILSKIQKQIDYPCIVKPSRCGSSVGISVATDENDVFNSINNALLFDDKIIVEKFLQNAREFCCAVIKKDKNLFSGKVQEIKKDSFYTFEEKYLSYSQNIEMKFDSRLETKIKNLAVKTYSALDCDGVVRIDFLMDEKGKLFVNEVNSIPGSLAFNLFPGRFEDLIETLITDAVDRHKKRKSINYTFSSSAIEDYIKMSKNGKLGCK